ncbi:L-fuculose-phosphate aldolase [Salmonella enterica subsp. enterica serovar Muenchen]|uniref:L-fuculose-phosphate aldolase n=1 Tax=Salmonella enterica TaxID=28901 RepID=UPI001F0EFCAE|nr:L-fuculose-phosphate aldolase [Salmonella enterica]EEJ6214847.1 L-fuculose-phosphate aldolase [Salmonella enterica]MCH5442710.1 L-fuculose-phosphate aldolase [Salmonella enterica subsp. enterica serovar Muenchen]
MLLEKERIDIIEKCKKLVTHGLTVGTGGNISIFDRKTELMAISPSGIDYFSAKPDDIVIMDMNNNIIDSSRKPSSEWEMHSIFYKRRNDINAVVHTHSTYCTVLATLHKPLPASNYMVALAGYDVRCADYQTFGTSELAEAAFNAMLDRQAVLLANHGLLTGSGTLDAAFNIAEQLEHCAKIHCVASSFGEPIILDYEEMTLMKEKFRTYGQSHK